MFFSKTYSSSKLKQTLQHWAKLYKYPRDISESERLKFKDNLYRLETLIHDNKREEATALAKSIDKTGRTHFKKPLPLRGLEFILGLAVALVAAVIVRQIWFELYEIPTGSMRPTFREQDLLTVSKTAYGVNVPLKTEHFYFDPTHVQRGSVVVFSGDGLDLPDTETTFLYVFPYTKRYIKRMIGLPGDTVYFYGGEVFGLNKEGSFFTSKDWQKKLEYIPIISFEGKMRSLPNNTILIKQMNEEVGRLNFNGFGDLTGELKTENGWEKSPKGFSELWGIGNYAKAQLLTKEQAKREQANSQGLSVSEEAPLYLELFFNPTLSKPNLIQESRGYQVTLGTDKTLIPLDKAHLDRLMDNLYTARFIVKNEKAARYDLNGGHFSSYSPSFPNVPNGTYEFYYGKGYTVGLQGLLSSLDINSPLYDRSPENVQKLFNLGIEFDTHVSPNPKASLTPSRYAYFRDGDLYVMGAPLFFKDELASKKIPFTDASEPSEQLIKEKGLKIPEGHYLVLGDNHAMSGDSRLFGFVPENNLQGAPSIIFWPAGERWGFPNMIPYPLFNPGRIAIWILGLLAFIIWRIYRGYKLNKPLKI